MRSRGKSNKHRTFARSVASSAACHGKSLRVNVTRTGKNCYEIISVLARHFSNYSFSECDRIAANRKLISPTDRVNRQDHSGLTEPWGRARGGSDGTGARSF